MNPFRHQPARGCLTVLLSLTLVACGGGGSGGSSPSGAAPVAAAPLPSSPAPAASAIPPLPGASAPDPSNGVVCASGDAPLVASAGFSLINVVRIAAGLPAFLPLAGLEATAQAHAQYVAVNGSGGSEQSAALPCYTGATLAQRLDAAGVVPAEQAGVRPKGESVLTYAAPSGTQIAAWDIVNDALNNLYGRMLLLSPSAQHGGLGLSVQPQRRAVVLDTTLRADGASAMGNALVVWPRDGTTGLPVRMLASNLKPLDAALVEGYPVTLHAVAPVRVSRFVMTNASSGTPVEATLVTSADDRHAFLTAGETALVPTAPLAAGTQYRVELEATVGTEAVVRVWTFTTAP
jgi:hypothetical protein